MRQTKMILKKLCVEKINILKEENNTKSLTASFIASSAAVDRYGDIIDQNGWQLENYKSNPIILFNHDATQLSIGRGEVEVVDGNLMIDIVFDSDDPRAAEIGRKVNAGFLNAVSVGFNAIEQINRDELSEDHYAYGQKGMFFPKAELLEVSIVTIPANQEAVAAKKYTRDLENVEAISLSKEQAIELYKYIDQLRGSVVAHGKQADFIESLFDLEDRYYDDEDDKDSTEKELTKEVTDFPKAGDDKKVSLKNTSYDVFPLDYAEDIKENYPAIWSKGGNILGNQQFNLLKRIQENNGVPETENQDEAIRLREAWAARHLKDFRLAGTVAQMKWLVIGEKGLQYMKDLINDEKEKYELGSKPKKEDEEKSFSEFLNVIINQDKI